MAFALERSSINIKILSELETSRLEGKHHNGTKEAVHRI